MKFRKSPIAVAAAALLVAGVASAAKDPEWKSKKPAEWSLDEVKEILNKSAWVESAEVFPAALQDPNAGKEKPTGSARRVGLLVRWQSAGILRHATVRAMQLQGQTLNEAQVAELTRPSDRFYMISVSAPETLAIVNTIPYETLAGKTTLEAGDKKFPLLQVITPEQNKAPEAVFLFDKKDGIPEDAKKAVFSTQFGEAKVKVSFDLGKMKWQGKRDLDGDIGELTAEEKTRREVQTAVLGAGDDAFARAVTDVKMEKRKDPKRPWAVYVFYDPDRELTNPAEARMVDTEARKLAVSQALGTWSKSRKDGLEAVIFVDPAKGKATDYVVGADTEKLAKMKDDAAKKAFKSMLKKPDDGKKSSKK